ncbi:hypothetical protein OKA05_09410 [Luteolibacter arcticus]|uniref:HNH nuclease domain-containing protein n=1 Tax=Luteolibacter arcticus TaxID=1581411 RepID=A0ABT3GGM2_9BACT|nr:hypothetical protein [Luteolibacter arcticus]MCW1922767.1 hypothetical protein [Luteolibacter arcticus]
MDAAHWQELATKFFPELEPLALSTASPAASDSLENLAYLAEEAHRTGDTALLNRIYPFVRWSIRNTADDRLKGWLADWFFDRILQTKHAKTGCLDYLDWGDVDLLCSHFTVEPMFEDTENFERLCKEWKKRWSRNQKLPHPGFE